MESKKKKFKECKRKRKRKVYDDSTHDDSISSESDRRHKRHRKQERNRRTDRRKDKSKKKIKKDTDTDSALQRNYALADALTELVDQHPALATDLPVILVRLARGTTFDLRSMPADVGHCLAAVLQCLVPFGVGRDAATGSWGWTSPTVKKSAHSSSNNNASSHEELVLVRVVRAMLDQTGFTLDAIQQFENSPPTKPRPEASTTEKSSQSTTQTYTSSVEELVKRLLDSFDTKALGGELAGLCNVILNGESVSLDALPDPKLRSSLAGILGSCGLVQAEMESDDDDDDDEPQLGYALPENSDRQQAQDALARVQQLCNTFAARPERIQGPKRPPTNYKPTAAATGDKLSDDEDEEIGPSVVPREKHAARADIEFQAARRKRELAHVAAGQGALPDDDANPGGREEWMVTPGKSDFFDFIKRGEPLKSRKFQGKAKSDADANDAPMDPAVRVEMDAIYQAHAAARGPSLMEEHQAAKKVAAVEQQQQNSNEPWKWSRNQDLDAGRRVDKDALQMVLGGAATGLQSKFQGGFRGGG